MNGAKESARGMTPNAAALKMLAGSAATNIVIAGLLFAGAGRLDWGLGWLFVAVWGLLKFVFVILLRWQDPALLVERVTRHENTQRYDRLIVPVYFVLSFGTILAAGLDGGRFRWSGDVPAALIFLAYVIYLFGNWLAAWAVSANPFFSSESRLQMERNQTVTQSGPYRFVRHPAYLAAIIIWLVTGVMLESWWTVIPGLAAALAMIVRTACEDRMLQTELTGYADYARQVRCRLFPGIW